MSTIREKFVPRHFRLGASELPSFKSTRSIPVEVPITDDDGNVIGVQTMYKSVPASDEMSKFRVGQFKLEKLLEAGVPLEIVNVNRSSMWQMDKLVDAMQNVEYLEKVKSVLERQKEERDLLFPQSVNDQSDNVNVES